MRTVILCSVVTAVALAQGVDKTKAPETPPLAAYKLPAVKESKLPNGLAVLMVRDARLPLVTSRIVFRAGNSQDPENLRGLSETTASLLKAGTAKRNAKQIAEELAAMGGSLDAGSGTESLTVSGFALSDQTAKWLELAADVVRNASFPQSEIDLRKQNRMQELQMELSDSSTIGNKKLREVVFGKHSYAHTMPEPAAIQAITQKDLLSFRTRLLTPANATLIMVGALPAEAQLLDSVKQHFGTWSGTSTAQSSSAEIPKPARSITLIDRPGSAQIDILAGHQTVNRMHADFFPLIVGNTILGGGASSRMFTILREKHGFAYQANSMHMPFKDTGIVQMVTQVREEVLEKALDGLFTEMDRMGKEAVTASELSNVKNYLNGFFVMGLASQDGVAGQLATLRATNVPMDYLEQYVTRVRSVEPEQIQRVGAKYLSSSDSSVVIVGDASKIAKTVEKFGKVTVEKAK